MPERRADTGLCPGQSTTRRVRHRWLDSGRTGVRRLRRGGQAAARRRVPPPRGAASRATTLRSCGADRPVAAGPGGGAVSLFPIVAVDESAAEDIALPAFL